MSVAVVLAVAVAGGVGSVARFVLDGVISSRIRGSAPVGTMTINITGSLLLGLLTGVVLAAALPPAWAIIGGTGFLGGYTTFSTASNETVRLLRAGRTASALASGLGTAVVALVAALLGLWTGLRLA